MLSRVVNIYPNTPNPVTLERMESIERHGYETWCVYWHRRDSPLSLRISTSIPAERLVGIDLPDPRGSVARRAILTARFTHRLGRHLKRLAPDVLWPVFPDMLAASRIAGHGTPTVYDLRDITGGPEGGMPWLLKRVYRWALQEVRAVVTTSERFGTDYLERHGLVNGQPVLYGSNCPSEWPRMDPPVPRSGRLRIGWFGQIRHGQPPPELLESVATLRSSGWDVSLHVAGTGPDSDNLRKTWPGEKHGCHYLGAYDGRQAWRLYEEVDVVFAAYPLDQWNYRHHLPRRFHEAILSQRPVITARGSYAGHLACQMRVGWQAWPNDVTGLVRELASRPFLVSAASEMERRYRKHHLLGAWESNLVEAVEAARLGKSPN